MPVRPITDGGGGATAAGSGKGAIFPPILINIGDLLSYWTAGLLKSTVHRVVFPQEDQQQQQDRSDRSRDRYSIAYFCHPVDHTELVPVPSQLVEERIKQNTIAAIGQRQRLGNSNDAGDAGEAPLTAREHLAGRLAATYGGSKEEYQ